MNNKYQTNIIKIINEIKRTNQIPRNTKITIDILMYKDETDRTLLEYMLQNKIVCYYSFIPEIPKIKEAVFLMYKYGKINELFNIDTKIYLSKINDDKTLLEELIEHNEIDNIHNLKFEYDDKLVEILKNKNRLDLFKKISLTENKLFEFVNQNNQLIEMLINKNIIDYVNLPQINYHTELIEILGKYNRLDIVEKITFSEKILLENNQNCLLKKILDLGYIPELRHCKTKTLDYLYKLNRPELMTKIFLEEENINYLFHYLSLNENVIDYLLNSDKTEKNINIRDLTTHIYQLEESELINVYLKFAKYDKLDYLVNISKEELLKRNKKNECMLDKFVKNDIENTKQIIKYYGLSNDIDIMLYFKFKKINYDPKGIDFELLDRDIYSYEFILEQNENLKNTINYNNISDEIKGLLLEFQDLMNDNQSNNDMVEAMLLSYAKEISKGNQNAIIELKKLIEIKKNNSNFIIFRSDNGSYFNENKGIGLTSCDINTLNHELGHLFHYYLAQDSIPSELESELEKLINNEKLKNNIQILSIRLNNYEEKLLKEIEIEYDEWASEYFTEEKIIEIKEFLEMSKEEKIEQYIKLGYKEEDLNIMLSETYTYEQYMQCQKRIKCNEMFNNIMSTILPELRAISDIVDAVYAGDYHSSRLTTSTGEEIEGTFGHGISYYSSIDSIFQEMIANYSLILKSDNKERALAMLKELVGEDLINILNNFYKEKIIDSPIYDASRSI